MALQPTTMSRLDELQRDLQRAVDNAFNPREAPYRRVTVIFCHFDNDDLNVVPLEDELCKTFQEVYGFKTSKCIMRTTGVFDPGITLNKFLVTSLQRGLGDEGSLIIMVFSGHGEMREINQKNFLHVGGRVDAKGHLRGKIVKWVHVTSILHQSKADVLHILDCCCAAEATHHEMEVLAATSGTESAESSAKDCFTRALNEQLRLLGSRGPFTIANLHANMMQFRLALRLNYSPFYAARPDQPSIVLQRMTFHNRFRHINMPTNGPRVLVTAHVEGTSDQKTINDLKIWLTTNLPEHVKDIKIKLEGAWKAGSAVLLFSIPLQIWTQLPANPAYRALDMVCSENMAVVAAPSTTLASRPLPGPENQKPGYGFPLK